MNCLHAGSDRLVGQPHGGQRADFPGQLGIEIAAGIIGDEARWMMASTPVEIDCSRQSRTSPSITVRDGCGVRKLPNHMISKRRDIMAARQQFGYQHGALVAACAGHKDLHDFRTPGAQTAYINLNA